MKNVHNVHPYILDYLERKNNKFFEPLVVSLTVLVPKSNNQRSPIKMKVAQSLFKHTFAKPTGFFALPKRLLHRPIPLFNAKVDQQNTNTDEHPSCAHGFHDMPASEQPITAGPEIAKLTKVELQKALKECENTVSLDKHAYALHLFFPRQYREAFDVCHALNIELAQLKAKSSLGASIRYGWWKENIKNAIEDIPPNVPVLLGLSYIAKKYRLKYSMFRQLLHWRKVDFNWKQYCVFHDYKSNQFFVGLQVWKL